MLQTEQVLGERYQLSQQLGKNAGRQTWLATDIKVSPAKPVIVKLLAFSPQMQWEDLKLFEREAQVLKNLNHPRIPKYRDYFSLDRDMGEGLCWFALVQDYIPGKSVQQLLDEGKHFTQEQVRFITTQVLSILTYLHGLNSPVLHRDIKPSNLILGKDKQVYLVDFGAVADPTAVEGVTFTVVGTAGYAPLEQFYGKAVPASDLYALGATLIHLLTGTAPADLPQSNLRIQFRDRISLNPSFFSWIESLIEPDLERRFSSAAQALEALKTGHFLSPLVQTSRKPAGSRIQLKKSPVRLAIKIPRQITGENIITFVVKLIGLFFSQLFVLLPSLLITLIIIYLSGADLYGDFWGKMVNLETSILYTLYTWMFSIPIIVLLFYPWIRFFTALKQVMLGCFGNQAIYFSKKQLVNERELFGIFRITHRLIFRITEIRNIQYIFGEGIVIQVHNQKRLKNGKRFTEAETKEIATQLLNILIYLHELSPPVLHRDIKPSNIIWGKNGQVYLVDFGAVQEKAKAEGATFTVVGTGGYAPPEQLWGRAVPGSDLYALGAALIHLLTGTAPVNLPQRQMRLQFRDQVSLNASFAHWLETLIEPAPELRFSNARKALEALQANGSPSPLEAAYTDTQETTPQNRQRVVNIAIAQYIIAFFCVIALPSMFAMIWKAKLAEARNNIGAMNRAQQAYFLESQEFADVLQKLGVGIKPQTENYDYSIRSTPLTVFNYATPRKNGLRGYVGVVFLVVGNEELLTVAITCETESRAKKRPADPILRGNGLLCCYPKTRNVETRNVDRCTLLSGISHSENAGELAYRSFSYANAGQYDKALEVTQSINNADLKARALATIAITLAEKGQYDKAFEVAKTVKDGSSKQMALDAIAHYKKSP